MRYRSMTSPGLTLRRISILPAQRPSALPRAPRSWGLHLRASKHGPNVRGMRLITLALLLAPALAHADGREKGAFGVGLVLGEPTGICAKLYIKDDQAISVTAGSAF